LVFPKQVIEKCDYYSKAEWATHARSAQDWAQRNYLNLGEPFRVHNVYHYPSWIERFHGTHPPAIQQLISDIESGRIIVERRQTNDVEELLRSRWYGLGRLGLQILALLDKWRSSLTNRSHRVIRQLF
jgi:hypothetical protein